MNEPSSPTAPPHTRRTRIFAVVALAVAGVGFAFITAGGIGKNLVYYWGPQDVRAAGDKAVGATIRLGGLVAPDHGACGFPEHAPIVYGQGTSHLEFDVTDGHVQVHVKSRGVPPQMFRERIGVVVEGTMTEAGYFESQRLMVSHSNEYRVPKDGEAPEGLDVKELMRSLSEAEQPQAGAPPAMPPHATGERR